MTDRNPNILLVVLDSVRARNTSLHDHEHETTPTLSKLGRNGVVFEQARAPSRWSLPSHVSMFTGIPASEHCVLVPEDRLAPGNTVFDDLRNDGYETGLFSANPYLTTLDIGIENAFDTVERAGHEPLFDGANPGPYKGDVPGFFRAAVTSGKPLRSLANGAISKLAWDYPTLLPDRVFQSMAGGAVPGEVFTDRLLDWVDDVDGPWAACVNFMDAHHPYEPNPKHDCWDDGTVATLQSKIKGIPRSFYTGDEPWWKLELMEHRYDGAIRQADAAVGGLVAGLSDRDALDDTLIVVTSDHGEAFGERSHLRDFRLAGHLVGAHEVNLHVPLVIRPPGGSEGRSVTRPVSLTDLSVLLRPDGSVDAMTKTSSPVVASDHGIDPDDVKMFRDSGIDTRRYEQTAKVVYEQVDNAVRKYAICGGQSVVLDIHDAHTTVCIDENSVNRVESTFDGLQGPDLRQDGPETAEVDETTKHRLEDLGYR